MPISQPIPQHGGLGELPPEDLTSTAPAPPPPREADPNQPRTEYELPDSPQSSGT
jgi:hypothetical protein